MKRTKKKSAIITSALAMFLCVAMLIGTTFAWFTDTASTGVNKIQTGNLDIEFEYWNSTDDEYQPITAETVLFPESSKWEPGHTEVAYIKVSNAGNLALQYDLTVYDHWSMSYMNVYNKSVKLKDFVKIAIIDDVDARTTNYDRVGAIAAAEANGTTAIVDKFSKTGVILPNAEDQYFAIVAYMPETVGNEANPKKPDANTTLRFTLQVNATQTSYESDSFGNTYDDGLAIPAQGIDTTGMTESEISQVHAKVVTAINDAMNKGNAMLGMDIIGHYGLHLTNDTDSTLDMNGKSFTTASTSQQACVDVMYGTLTIKGDGIFDGSGNERTTSINNGGQAVCVEKNGNVIIENGTFIGRDGRSCIYTTGGDVVIKGGFFMIKDATTTPFVVNKQDRCGANVQIMGGTFVNFNPADTNTEPDGDNFVAAGYKVLSETKDNGDIWYTVVPE